MSKNFFKIFNFFPEAWGRLLGRPPEMQMHILPWPAPLARVPKSPVNLAREEREAGEGAAGASSWFALLRSQVLQVLHQQAQVHTALILSFTNEPEWLLCKAAASTSLNFMDIGGLLQLKSVFLRKVLRQQSGLLLDNLGKQTLNFNYYVHKPELLKSLTNLVLLPLYGHAANCLGILLLDRVDGRVFKPAELDALKPLIALLNQLLSLEEYGNFLAPTKAVKESALAAVTTLDLATGVYNYRHFHSLFEQIWARARRYNREFSLLLLEIDQAEEIKSAYGLEGLERILQRISQMLKEEVRASDVIARFSEGGLILLLEETLKEGAYKLAERLRVRIAGDNFIKVAAETKFACTVSLGLAAFPDDGPHKHMLLAAADAALYEAKKRGPNQTVKYFTFKSSLKPPKVLFTH